MRLNILLVALLTLVFILAVGLGETALSPQQFSLAFSDGHSPPAQILWSIRAPRAAAAALVGAALGLAGAVMQGLLRNPLADPGVLGVSAFSGLAAATVIALGLVSTPGAVETAALIGALVAGGLLTLLASRLAQPQTLILFGVALSSLGGALTALVFNLSPSPVTTAEVLSWLLGSVANRDWSDVSRGLIPAAPGAILCLMSGPGLSQLTLGDETAALSGLPMGRLRMAAVAGAALLTGAAVSIAGVVGFVGLAAPHLVRRSALEDPARTLVPSALAGSVLLVTADLVARMIPSAEELKLGVVTSLFGAPVFAVLAWRASRSWRG